MSEVRIALGAARFSPYHSIRAISFFFDGRCIKWLKETWPAGAGIELSVRTEQRLSATRTKVCAFVFGIPVFPSECRFGSCFSCNLILFRRKVLFPFFIRLDYLGCHVLDSPQARSNFSCRLDEPEPHLVRKSAVSGIPITRVHPSHGCSTAIPIQSLPPMVFRTLPIIPFHHHAYAHSVHLH